MIQTMVILVFLFFVLLEEGVNYFVNRYVFGDGRRERKVKEFIKGLLAKRKHFSNEGE